MNWIELCNLLKQPINSFYNSVGINSNSVEKSRKELMLNFLKFFEGLGKCTKAKVTFKIKVNVMPISRPKRKVPFAAETFISKKLDCLEQIGLLTKVDYSEWASPTVYMKKKNSKIWSFRDFSTGLNNCLET